MSTPYIGFSNDALSKLPKVSKGQLIKCDKCKKCHRLECGTSDGKESDTIMFYKCGEDSYLGAVAGRLVAGLKADVNGEV